MLIVKFSSEQNIFLTQIINSAEDNCYKHGRTSRDCSEIRRRQVSEQYPRRSMHVTDFTAMLTTNLNGWRLLIEVNIV